MGTWPSLLLLSSILCAIGSALTVPVTTRRDSIVRIMGTVLPASSGSGMAAVDAPNVLWGIVGLGDVTETKSGPPFWKCEGSELIAVMRRTPGKAAEWANRVPGGHCVGYDSLDKFLQQPLDAVYVATRPGSHLEVCRRVAQAGIKSVYVEKPVGRCAAETRAIIDAFDSIGGRVYTAYISRAYPRTQAVRCLLRDNAIGQIQSVTYKLCGSGGARDIEGKELPWRFDVSQSGGGLLMDVGCHVLDRIDYLFGPLNEVSGIAEKRGMSTPGIVEDYVSITATARPSPENDVSIRCVWDFSNDEATDILEIVGSNGSIRMAGMSMGPITVAPSNAAPFEKSFEPPSHNGQYMIQAVTDSIRGTGETSFLSTGENALRTSKVLDVALASYYGDRSVGYWEPDLG